MTYSPTEHGSVERLEERKAGGATVVIRYQVTCSCGRFTRKGAAKEPLLRKLDKHMEDHA